MNDLKIYIMKNLKKMFAILVAATTMFIWTGHSKEGSVEPKGDTGNANALATKWLSFRTTGDGGSEESDLSSDPHSMFVWTINAPILNSINSSDDSTSVVLIYFKEHFGGNSIYLLPKFINNLFEYNTLMSAAIEQPNNDKPAFLSLRFNSLGNNTELITPNKLAPKLDMYHYRIVVVPQATTKSTGTTSLKEELENMSYLEVCERYGIEP